MSSLQRNPDKPEARATEPAVNGRGNGDGKSQSQHQPDAGVVEQGGPGGPEPTRFGDWERKGRCIDF